MLLLLCFALLLAFAAPPSLSLLLLLSLPAFLAPAAAALLPDAAFVLLLLLPQVLRCGRKEQAAEESSSCFASKRAAVYGHLRHTAPAVAEGPRGSLGAPCGAPGAPQACTAYQWQRAVLSAPQVERQRELRRRPGAAHSLRPSPLLCPRGPLQERLLPTGGQGEPSCRQQELLLLQ